MVSRIPRLNFIAALLCLAVLGLAAIAGAGEQEGQAIEAKRLRVVYFVDTGQCDIVIAQPDQAEDKCFATVSNLSNAKKIVDHLLKGEIAKAQKIANDEKKD